MKFILVAMALATSSVAFAQVPDDVLRKAHEACEGKLSVSVGSKGVPSYPAGYEGCVEVEASWKNSEAEKRQKADAEKSAIEQVRKSVKKQ